jgi:hypothetical protein
MLYFCLYYPNKNGSAWPSAARDFGIDFDGASYSLSVLHFCPKKIETVVAIELYQKASWEHQIKLVTDMESVPDAVVKTTYFSNVI